MDHALVDNWIRNVELSNDRRIARWYAFYLAKTTTVALFAK